MDNRYVVYLTTYLGDKLPKYYIGSTTKLKIESGKYFGTVRSKRYRKIFESELKNNGNLFSVQILSYHETRNDVLIDELRLQKENNVVKSDSYFNESYASIGGCFGRNVNGCNNPMFNRINEVIAINENGDKIRINSEEFRNNNKLSGHTIGFLYVKNNETNKLIKITKEEFFNNRDKYKHFNDGIKHSNKTKNKLSKQRKNMTTVKDWNNNHYRVNKDDERIKNGVLVNNSAVRYLVRDKNGVEYKIMEIKKFFKNIGVIFNQSVNFVDGELITNHNPRKGKSLNGWMIKRIDKIKKYELQN